MEFTNSLLKKIKEFDVDVESALISLVLDNEMDALIVHSHLSQLFKDLDLELFIKIYQPENKKRSKIDLGIIALSSHERVYVKEIEIENAAFLYVKLIHLKSNMSGLIENEEPRQPKLSIINKPCRLSQNSSDCLTPVSGKFLEIKKLTIISTPGGEEILKIPEANP
jgi:hypothetical protein